ncbi:protein kinase domain-containing protein [Enhygromyxa salina]|uniref:Serine/threonine-protein kinase PK-1 n=1 Tax=Enhygromyxa salina TaxID=215803 RepID=A0A2S9YUU7_9BACT|nr:tetratricopeptide repeat protein [Enhygromyxa salina]PRQ08812.1 Serine/threonine-protein kinase PK-1 [Enhygromyxa salina]
MKPADTPPSQDCTLVGEPPDPDLDPDLDQGPPDATRVEFGDAQQHTSRPPRGGTNQRPLARGDEVGRYVILERVGAGGMGVVYAAWDPNLDRKVALKLLHGNRHDHSQRLQREAQALARLTHPNVISVHDAGTIAALDDRVFVAMEFIEGQTLRGWAGVAHDHANRSTPAPARVWSETLDVMLAAGRGLAAAHDHDLIHRDFKPDNVMIGDDGRVCVMDFGLARAARGGDSLGSSTDGHPTSPSKSASALRVPTPAATQASEPPGPTGPRHVGVERVERVERVDGGSVLESELTMAGSLLGTPAYMAPEQLRSDETDARADQFSFCVTTWQCLYGVRPFAGDTPLALLFAISNAKFTEPPSTRAVPTRIRRALERGLAARPEQRWPDMHALLRALADDPVARRRPWVLGLGSLALAAAAATAAIELRNDPLPPPPPCEHAGARLQELWSDARTAELAQVFARSELVYADETWTRAAAQLDTWSAAWVAARVDACEATELRHEQSPELLDLRMACLDQRLLRLGALLDVLDHADDAVIEKTIEAVEALPSLEVCADQSWLTAARRPPDDPTLAAAVERVREDVAQIEAMVDGGKSHDALPLAEQTQAAALELGWQPTLAEAGLALGRVRQERGEFTEARAALEAAFFAARRGSQDEVSVNAASLLVYTFAAGLGEFEAARAWTEHALAEAERVGRDDLLAEVHTAIGIAHYFASEIPAAAASFERALELHDEDEESTSLAAAHINYGTILIRVGDEHERRALAELELGLEMLEHRVGPQHPALALSLSNYATVHGTLDHFSEAIALLERALEINERALGPHHPMTALVELNLGKNLLDLAELAEPAEPARAALLERAQALADRSLTAHLQVFGPQHIMVAQSQRLLGRALLELGRPAEAIPPLDAAIEIWTATFGADHTEVAQTQLLRARCD